MKEENHRNGLEKPPSTLPTTASAKKKFIFSPASLISRHYGSTTYNRSEAQLERERYLIPPRFIPFNRWALIPAAVIIQFCCGSLYAWSVYNDPIEKYMYGVATSTASITFYLAIGGLGIAAALFGPWLERNGPMKTALLGTCGFYLGNLLAALAVYTKQMWLLYIGYGVIGGCAIGICYISPVSALQKFFPDRRGLASGFAVCGFGAGSIAASPLQKALMDSVGVPLTFVVLGSAYFVVMLVASLVLRTPPPDYTVRGLTVEGVKVALVDETEDQRRIQDLRSRPAPILKMTLLQALRTRDFWLMFAMFFGNVVTGLVVLSRLASMVEDIFGRSKTDSTMVVAVNGGLNLFGRFFFSLLSDKIGRKTVFLISLCTQAIIVACMNPILAHKPDSYWAFVVLIWIMSACYGCSFGVIPAFLADMFGSSNIGACHGVMLIGWSTAGIGGGLIYTAIFKSLIAGSYTTKDAFPYFVNFHWLLAIIIAAFLLTLFIRTNAWHRLLADLDRGGRGVYVSTGQRLVKIKACCCRSDDEDKTTTPAFKFMNREEIIGECDRLGGLEAYMDRKGLGNGGEAASGTPEIEVIARL